MKKNELNLHSTKKEVLWKFKTNGGISSLICSNDIIYFGSKDGNLYAVDTATNKELWHFSSGGPILCQPYIYNDLLFFSSTGTFYALNITTGEQVWKNDQEANTTYRHDKWDFHDSSPVVDNNVVYFGNLSGHVYGFDIENGEKVWDFTAEATVRSTPYIADGIMYFGDWNGVFYSVDIETKEVKWKIHNNKPFQSSPTIYDNTIFYSGRDTKLHAVDVSTGEEKWSYADPIGSWITAYPIVLDGIVYIGKSDATEVIGLDIATGELKFTYKTKYGVYSKLIIDNNILYVGSGNPYDLHGKGMYQAFDLKDPNKVIWEIEIENGGVFTSSVLSKDVIYFGSEDGYVYAVSIK